MSLRGLSAAVLILAAVLTPTLEANPGEIELSTRFDSQWAYVLTATTARLTPSRSAHAVANLATTTPEGETNLVLALAERYDPNGHRWVQVRLPSLPNGATGWVSRTALGDFHKIHTRLVVDRARLIISLFRKSRLVFRTDVGIGRPAWPTPRGEFYIRERLIGFGDAFYGPIALGTTGRSTQLTDWPRGGFIGIHGTDQPQLIPGRISHGCIRLRNEDILRLSRLLPLGTPLTIR